MSDKEKTRATHLQWRIRNRKKIRAKARESRKQPKILERERAYWKANREHINAMKRARYHANLETERGKKRVRAAEQRQRIREREATDPIFAEERKAKRLEYRLRHKAKKRAVSLAENLAKLPKSENSSEHKIF